jgi:hypothetical protein
MDIEDAEFRIQKPEFRKGDALRVRAIFLSAGMRRPATLTADAF